jgi:FkbM family methyltransferase
MNRTLRLDMPWGPTLHTVPESMWVHLKPILEGSYDVPYLEFAEPPRVLDIGACVGTFAVWAAQRWAGAKIHCYEPNPSSYAMLCANAGALTAESFNLGVREKRWEGPLWMGENNPGECSFDEGLRTSSATCIDVECVAASELRPCDVLKVDTEGCELEILRNYPHLGGVSALMVEWHRRGDRAEIERIAADAGLTLCGGKTYWLDLGELKFVRVARLPEERR